MTYGLSHNCSTEGGFEVGAPEEGFDIAVVSHSLELIMAYIKATVKPENGGEIHISTTHAAVGEHIEQLGNGSDITVVAVVTETFMDEDEEITLPMCLVFKMNTKQLT